jgi:uncharacterized membrane protein YkoI
MIRTGILVACLLSAAALADSDQDAARRAFEAGKAVPFDSILEEARRDHPGRVLGVELERDDGRLVYELRILEAGGRIGEWKYDAETGQSVDEQGAGRHSGSAE